MEKKIRKSYEKLTSVSKAALDFSLCLIQIYTHYMYVWMCMYACK